MMITHDLGVIAEVADDVMVMYAGKSGGVRNRGRYFRITECIPYTEGLMNCIPKLADEDRHSLATIKGMVPSFDDMPEGCVFCPRCANAPERSAAEERRS